jgi:hypothetical protein
VSAKVVVMFARWAVLVRSSVCWFVRRVTVRDVSKVAVIPLHVANVIAPKATAKRDARARRWASRVRTRDTKNIGVVRFDLK